MAKEFKLPTWGRIHEGRCWRCGSAWAGGQGGRHHPEVETDKAAVEILPYTGTVPGGPVKPGDTVRSGRC
jgi:pyruvate/2-oxoglutarate dehydrogenase complex dihydrolipoamide acyltransferase (E2) component